MTRARDVANLIGSGNYSSTTFTATAGQTAFTISHTQGFIQVFMNGLLLDETVDYTSNGSAVTLTSGAAAGDEIEVVAYNTFSVGDALNQAAADTRYVNTTGDTMTGNLSITGDLFVTNSTNAKLSVSDQIGEVGSGNLAFQAQNTAGSALKPMGFRAEDIRFATGSNERMRIDGSGRVTMPYQPAFRAYDNEAVTNNGVIVFDSVNQRGGTNYSTSNGRFTCPVSGWYHFHFKYLTTSGDTRNDCSFYKNGSVYVEQRNYKDSGVHESYDVVAVDYFSANDYITCNIVYGDVYNFATWSSWYGYLIG